MKTGELLVKLGERVVFSPMDVEALIGKKRNYAYLLLQRLERAGLIYRIEKGRYTCHKDSLLVASRIVWPSYISCWAALQHHHLTEQMPSVIEVITSRSRKKRKTNFMNVTIEFSRFAVPHFFGYDKIFYKNFSILIATKEKALLDAFFLKRLSPTEFKEIVKNNKKKISISKLKKYAKKFSKTFFSKIKKMVENHD